jgi:hypothetical protein
MNRVAAFLIATSSAVILLGTLTVRGQEAGSSAVPGPQPVLPKVSPNEITPNAVSCGDVYPDPPGSLTDRRTYCASRTQQGTTVPIPEADVIKFCSGKDGCIVRMGMYDWDQTGRVASRHFLFYYNKDNRTWRSEMGDTSGQNANNVTEHVANIWNCYFTDGAYEKFADKGDSSTDFGLMSWNTNNSDCFLTFVR